MQDFISSLDIFVSKNIYKNTTRANQLKNIANQAISALSGLADTATYADQMTALTAFKSDFPPVITGTSQEDKNRINIAIDAIMGPEDYELESSDSSPGFVAYSYNTNDNTSAQLMGYKLGAHTIRLHLSGILGSENLLQASTKIYDARYTYTTKAGYAFVRTKHVTTPFSGSGLLGAGDVSMQSLGFSAGDKALMGTVSANHLSLSPALRTSVKDEEKQNVVALQGSVQSAVALNKNWQFDNYATILQSLSAKDTPDSPFSPTMFKLQTGVSYKGPGVQLGLSYKVSHFTTMQQELNMRMKWIF